MLDGSPAALLIDEGLLGITGHDDAVEAGRLLDGKADQLASSHAGHDQIRDQYGDIRVPVEEIERLDAIGCDQYLEAMLTKMGCNDLTQCVFILDHENQALPGRAELMDW